MSSRSVAVSVRAALVLVAVVGSATNARADATAFGGALASDGVRPTFGVSVGNFPSEFGEFFGWELEFAKTIDGPTTYGGTFVGQSAVIADKLRVFGTFGLGLYASGSGQIGFGVFGGGTKIQMTRSLWLRLDYRVFAHGSDTPEVLRYPQRVTAGLGFAF